MSATKNSESADITGAFTEHQTQQTILTHQEVVSQASQYNLEVKSIQDSGINALAEYIRKREQLEAKEEREHKRDFVEYFTDMLTHHKIENQGR